MTATATKTRITFKALHNDSVALLTWTLGDKIENCLGFAVTMVVQSVANDDGTLKQGQRPGDRTELLTYVPFKGEVRDRTTWQGLPSSQLPIQKTHWLHFFGGRQGTTVVYELVPMIGTPGNLKPANDLKVVSNPVTFTTKVDDTFECGFTRGVLSTQWLAHMLPTDADGLPDWQVLLKALQDPNNAIRKYLAGNVPSMWKEQIGLAVKEGGQVHLALYELSDPELVDFLLQPANIPHYSLILGNTGADDKTNAPARAKLHAAKAKIKDRIIGSWGIAHNKLQVRVNKGGHAKAVSTGSTNATFTGLCCQSNIITTINNDQVAALFLDYWKRMEAEGNDQSAAFRTANAKGCKVVKLTDGTEIEVWFSPNMKDKTKPQNDPPLPPDMARVRELMFGAKEAVVGEVFYPGKPSVVHWAAELWDDRPDLYMFMTVSTPDALKGVKAKRRKGRPPLFTIASGREQEFSNFLKELLKLPESHAVTHGKIIVIDPFGENPVVIYGSHNLGFKASYGNDENMVIVRGNKAFAQWVFVNMYDINSHYLARQAANAAARRGGRNGNDPRKKFGGLDTTDSWQDYWLKGYRAKEAQYLTTGVWDGSGMDDPSWLKSQYVLPWSAPRPRPAAVVGGDLNTGGGVAGGAVLPLPQEGLGVVAAPSDPVPVTVTMELEVLSSGETVEVAPAATPGSGAPDAAPETPVQNAPEPAASPNETTPVAPAEAPAQAQPAAAPAEPTSPPAGQ